MSAGQSLARRSVVSRLLRERRQLLVVTGLGSPTYDVAAADDHPGNFYLWGAMGGAAMVGLGLALAQPVRTVMVITGDGEMLMGLGGLATIALKAPQNLRIVVLDNELYGETGGQQSHTAGPVDLAAVGRGCGLTAVTIRRADELEAFAAGLADPGSGAQLTVIKISPEEPPRSLPSRDGVLLRARMRHCLGLERLDFEYPSERLP